MINVGAIKICIPDKAKKKRRDEEWKKYNNLKGESDDESKLLKENNPSSNICNNRAARIYQCGTCEFTEHIIRT